MAPAVVLNQSPHLLVHTFGQWAVVVLPLPQHLDFNEDAVDVLRAVAASAVDPLLDIPESVLRLLGVVVMLDREDDVGVVLLAALHLAENDIPYANLGSLLPYRVPAIHCCYSLDRMEGASVARLDQGPHRIARGLVEGGAAVAEILVNQPVPGVPEPELLLPLLGVDVTALRERPIFVE